MEHVAFIDDLPTKNGDLPYSFLYVYKRVSPVISCYIPKKKNLKIIGVYKCVYMGYKPLTKWDAHPSMEFLFG